MNLAGNRLRAALLGAIRNSLHHRLGWCTVCGKPTLFVCVDAATARNNMFCLFCRSSSRKRHVAKTLLEEVIAPRTGRKAKALKALPEALDIQVYNADIDEAIGKALGRRAWYTCSAWLPGVAAGAEIRPRVFCQNIEALSFPAESFDVVITEDVLEHVRDHMKAFAEIHRVLRPGGHHVFTVPFRFDGPTVTRVDTSGPEDVHLLPPQYHRDRLRRTILAYRTFGIDLFDEMKAVGFETSLRVCTYLDRRDGIVNSFVFDSVKVG